jgi:hypothetical protein
MGRRDGVKIDEPVGDREERPGHVRKPGAELTDHAALEGRVVDEDRPLWPRLGEEILG